MQNEVQDGLFGRLAVHRRFITMEQLTRAVAEQTVKGGSIRSILLDLGFIDASASAQLDAATEEILRRRLAEEEARFDEPSVVVQIPVPQPVQAPVPQISEELEAVVTDRFASRSFQVSIDFTEGYEPVEAPPAKSALEVDAERQARDWLVEVLKGVAQQGASDVHVHAGEPVRIRRFGRLWPVTEQALPPTLTELALRSLLDEHQVVRFEREGHVDGALSIRGVGRFRFNVYRQLWGVDGVLRVVRNRPPTLQSLNLPPSLARLTAFQQGIVLVTGPASSGKTSTLAALVHMINEERAEHVVCIEDPIEVVHTPIRCVVNQRQAGRDTKSFSRALRAALREDPDVIVIGELRDRETAQLALTAAETGHLVIATLHTHSAVRTINRIIGEFPPAQQPNIRAMLSESLRAIVSQRLLPRKDGLGVVPAVEVLMATPAVANLIRESRVHQLRSTMQTGAALGMQTLDVSLQALVTAGVVDAEEARRVAEDPRAITAPAAGTV
jgi:twitching motility protein PilT